MRFIEKLTTSWESLRPRKEFEGGEEEGGANQGLTEEFLAAEEKWITECIAAREKEQRINEATRRQDESIEEERASYREEYRAAVDRLRESSDDPDAFQLAYAMVAPSWFAEAMQGKDVRYPDGPWPHFVRTEARIDWQALLRQHPAQLDVDHDDLEGNDQPPFTVHLKVWEELDKLGLGPAMDVDLWMDENGRIMIWPSSVFGTSSQPITDQQVRAIETLIKPWDGAYTKHPEGSTPADQSSGQWFWY